MRKSVQILVALWVFSLHIAGCASPADERVEAHIKAQVGDESVLVRSGAASGLGNIGDKRAVEALIEALGGRDHSSRQAIAELVKIGKPAVEPLIKALSDEDEDVRGNAATALDRIADERAVGPLIKRAIVPLIKALGDEDDDVRRSAAYALGSIGDNRAVEPLIKALGDEEPLVRGSAAYALGSMDDKRVVELLINVLAGDKYPTVRRSAASGLGNIGDKRGVEPLIKALGDEYEDAREAAAEALGKIGDKRAVESLIKALADKKWWVRDAAAEALEKIGDKRAVDPLIEALGDENEHVRRDAARALSQILDKRAVGPLIKALGDEDDYVREAAAEALGKIGERRAVERLIKAVGDERPLVRQSAAEALGKIGDLRALRPLIKAYNDKEVIGTEAIDNFNEVLQLPVRVSLEWALIPGKSVHWGGREAVWRGRHVTKFKDGDRLLGIALVQSERGEEAILVSEISYIDDILYLELPIRDSEVIDLRAHGRRYKYWVTHTASESYINLKGRKSHRCSLSELYRKRFEAAIQVGHVALLGDTKDPKIFYLMYQGGDKPALLLWDNTMVSAASEGYVRDRALTPTYALFFDEERGKTNAFRAGDRSYHLVLTDKGHGRAWFLEEEYIGVPSEEALDELEKLDEILLELER